MNRNWLKVGVALVAIGITIGFCAKPEKCDPTTKFCGPREPGKGTP